jgi:MFS transporter, PPP family, 3-phenylpropionic acid transporter
MLGAIGAFGPFLGLVLEREGYSAVVIGGVFALVPVVRIIVTPVWALIADRFQLGTRILQGASLATALIVGAIASGALGMGALAVAMVLFAIARAPVAAVLDGLTVRSLEDRGADPRAYGRIRLWGSVSFLLCAGTAAVLAEHVAWAMAPIAFAAVAWALGFLVTLALPRVGAVEPARLWPAIRALSKRRGLMMVALALPLHGMGLNAYDAWYAMHIESLGLASTWTGVAVVVGVSVEITVMAFGGRILRRFDPMMLVAASMGVGAVRWALTAAVSSPWLLTALQLLHGVVFAMFWIGVVEVFRRSVPSQLRVSGQSVVMVACYGLGPLLTSLAGASLVDTHGTPALFLAASAAAVVAAALMLGARARMGPGRIGPGPTG